jgi:hypothetical protein
MVRVARITLLSIVISLNLSADIFDDLLESLHINIDKGEEKSVVIEGEKIEINNSTIKKENLGKVLIEGEEIRVENSEIVAHAEEKDDVLVAGENGLVHIDGSKVEVKKSIIKASSSIGSKSVSVGTNGSIVLGSH